MIFGLSKSIFRRLLFSYMVTVLLGLCVAGLLVAFFAKGYITDSKQAELLRMAKRVNLAIQDHQVPDDSFKQILQFFDESYDTRIWVFDPQGRIIATSSKDEVSVGKSVDPSIVRKVSGGEDAVLHLQFEGIKQPMLSVVVPWGKDDRLYGGIVLHASVTGINETITNLREMILWVTLIALVITVGIASYLSWSISRPLQTMERIAAKIGSGEFEARICVEANDELGDLADRINSMADRLERTDREKRHLELIRQDFLANVSHELRTPLTAMRGFLEALQDDLIEENGRRRYYDIMYNETLYMNRLVDDLTDLMKLENHEITLYRNPVDAEQLLQKTAFAFAHEAEEKGLTIRLDVDPALPKVYADWDRLGQIMNNLVKNAIKFTEEGTIFLSAKPETGGMVELAVSDSGIGISPEDRERVWERFFKVDRGRSKKGQGSGLGLAIVRELVRLHDGETSLDSGLDAGTTIRVRFPSIDAMQVKWREEKALPQPLVSTKK